MSTLSEQRADDCLGGDSWKLIKCRGEWN